MGEDEDIQSSQVALWPKLPETFGPFANITLKVKYFCCESLLPCYVILSRCTNTWWPTYMRTDNYRVAKKVHISASMHLFNFVGKTLEFKDQCIEYEIWTKQKFKTKDIFIPFMGGINKSASILHVIPSIHSYHKMKLSQSWLKQHVCLKAIKSENSSNPVNVKCKHWLHT